MHAFLPNEKKRKRKTQEFIPIIRIQKQRKKEKPKIIFYTVDCSIKYAQAISDSPITIKLY